MPGFFEITQGGWKVWGLIVSSLLVILGGGLTVYNQISGGSLSQGGPGAIPLKCSAQGCDWAEAISIDKKNEWAAKEYQQWKIEHPGEQPIDVNKLMLRDSFMRSEQQLTPEQMIEQSIIERWGSFHDHLPFTCPKCSQKTVYEAFQCEKCGDIFFLDYVNHPDLPDTCPKCSFSKRKSHIEAAQKKKAEMMKKK